MLSREEKTKIFDLQYRIFLCPLLSSLDDQKKLMSKKSCSTWLQIAKILSPPTMSTPHPSSLSRVFLIWSILTLTFFLDFISADHTSTIEPSLLPIHQDLPIFQTVDTYLVGISSPVGGRHQKRDLKSNSDGPFVMTIQTKSQL